MTARINLLPWRQRRRDRQRHAFLAQLGVVFGSTACLVVLATIALEGRIDNQDARNQFLLASIGELERRIDEIEVVRRRTDETTERIQTLANLRRDRARTVRIFDELARTIAPGVHYTSVVKRGPRISAHGIAHSNNNISALMRSLSESERFDAPKLKGIEEAAGEGNTTRAAVFEITFATRVPEMSDGGS